MPPVAAITPSLKPCVARIIPVLYASSITKSVPNVRPTACIATPGYVRSNMAEMPPSARPSRSAYIGAVSGAHSFLKMVTSATTKPPKRPPIIHGMAASGAWECDRPQVHAAVATTQSRRKPVLLTVPCSVIASPKATWPRNAFSLSAGLEVRIRFAMAEILPYDEFLISRQYVYLNSTTWVLSYPRCSALDEIAQVGLGSPAI